jgi:hypothetical protein
MTLGLKMPPRMRKYIWRFLDLAMPDGPPLFLTFVIVLLLILNGGVLLLR